MRKLLLAIVACAIVAGGAPAGADGSHIEGFVVAPVPAPSIPRTLYRVSGGEVNGVVGFVAEIPCAELERSYRLVPGATGVDSVNLDAWFYNEITGTGEPCARVSSETEDGGETGTICPGAKFAVVVLFLGADADFTLEIG